MLEAEAKERQLATLKQNQSTVPEKIPERNQSESREQAARLMNTNPRYVSDAKKIREADPEIFEKVRSGEKTIPRAGRPADENKRNNRPRMAVIQRTHLKGYSPMDRTEKVAHGEASQAGCPLQW